MAEKNSIFMPLRPHHGLCMRFYVGKGYDENFVANADKIHRALSENAAVVLCGGADALCEFCPQNSASGCGSGEKSARYDRAVLSLCGLSAGDTLSWNELQELIEENIFKTGGFDTLCSDCEWSELCRPVK